MMDKMILVSGLFWNDSTKDDETVELELLWWLARYNNKFNYLNNTIMIFLEKPNHNIEYFLKENPNVIILYFNPYEEYKDLYNRIKKIYNGTDKDITSRMGKTFYYNNVFLWLLKSNLVLEAHKHIVGKFPEEYHDSPLMWVDFGIRGYINKDITVLRRYKDDHRITMCHHGVLKRYNDDIVTEKQVMERYKAFINDKIPGYSVGSLMASSKLGWEWFNREITKLRDLFLNQDLLVDDDFLYDIIYARTPQMFDIVNKTDLRYPLDIMTEYLGK